MEIEKQELWELLVEKAEKKDKEGTRKFLDAVKEVCEYGITLSLTIRDTFPTYTLHNETHIRNVMNIMLKLLRERKTNLHMEECAMLMMAACCHDIGMSVDRKEKEYLQSCPDCMKEYLEKNPKDYTTAYAKGVSADPQITDEILQHYVRANHHNRVLQQLQKMENGWPSALGGYISARQLAEVCQSHGENPEAINALSTFAPELDLHLCAVLLRLGDILDFDATRAPDALYRYINLEELDGMEAEKSRQEWKKHKSSSGFQFSEEEPYALFYRASCTCIQIEQAVVDYLDWVDTELVCCGRLVRNMGKNWNNLLLPSKVERQIVADGYLSGQYKITLDQEKVIDLLIGRNLYSDPAIFVRELLQNAIDAVRTRKLLDKNLPKAWKPQINIHTWIDEDGYDWFRIEDNGIGMSEETIRNYFLKVGHSYYTSDQFRADKLRCEADPDYAPISRFGIGILSCFMGDPKNNRVEVTTKHFTDNGKHYPAYRISIQGINGFYYLASNEDHREAAPKMPDFQKNELRFRSEPGTIIAVRTKLYGSGGTKSFKDILDKYIAYPEIPIHYGGPEGSCDYRTEEELMSAVYSFCGKLKNGTYFPIERVPVPEIALKEIQYRYPEWIWEKYPSIAIYCLPVDDFVQTSSIHGEILIAKVEGKGFWKTAGITQENFPQVYFRNLYYYDSEKIFTFKMVFSEEPPEKDSQGRIFSYAITLVNVPFNIEKLKQSNQMIFSLLPCEREKPQRLKQCLVSNNGILVEHSLSFGFLDARCFQFLILLKDRNCCTLDLARDSIQEVPLETICFLEVLIDRIQKNLNLDYTSKPKFDSPFLHRLFSTKFPLKLYWEILKDIPALYSGMTFSTAFDGMSLSDIESAVQRGDKILLSRNTPFYMAALIKNFSLKIAKSQKGNIEIYIVGQHADSIPRPFLSLPPALFLMPDTLDIKEFSIANNYSSISRYAPPYNALHPFAQWFQKNQLAFSKLLPGLYSQLLYILIRGSERSSDLQNNINSILIQLRKIPNWSLEIPDILTEDDFSNHRFYR